MNNWQSPETAPRDGTLIIGDFGWPWPSLAVWNECHHEWVYANLQASIFNGKPDTFFENEYEKPSGLKRWMPHPSLDQEKPESEK